MIQEIDKMSIEDGSYYESTKSLPSYQGEGSSAGTSSQATNEATNEVTADDGSTETSNPSQPRIRCIIVKVLLVVVVAAIVTVLCFLNPLFFLLWISVGGLVLLLYIGTDVKAHKVLFVIGLCLLLGGIGTFLGLFVKANMNYTDPRWYRYALVRSGWWNKD